jgi:hypothetical protein
VPRDDTFMGPDVVYRGDDERERERELDLPERTGPR